MSPLTALNVPPQLTRLTAGPGAFVEPSVSNDSPTPPLPVMLMAPPVPILDDSVIVREPTAPPRKPRPAGVFATVSPRIVLLTLSATPFAAALVMTGSIPEKTGIGTPGAIALPAASANPSAF